MFEYCFDKSEHCETRELWANYFMFIGHEANWVYTVFGITQTQTKLSVFTISQQKNVRNRIHFYTQFFLNLSHINMS